MKKYFALFLVLLMSLVLLSACNSADPNQPWDDPNDPWHTEASPKIITGNEDEEDEESGAVLMFNQV